MYDSNRHLRVLCTFLFLALSATTGSGRTKERMKKGEIRKPVEQRIPTSPQIVARSTISNIQFYESNYGIFSQPVAIEGPTVWPRGSSNDYIFGGGIWFGARKAFRDSSGKRVRGSNGADSLRTMSIISYDPHSAQSWFVPGTIREPVKDQPMETTSDAISNYRLYVSTDYNPATGDPADVKEQQQGGPRWPIWDTRGDTLGTNRYFGEYIEDAAKRGPAIYPKGPAIMSDEDFFSVYRDNDLSHYGIPRDSALGMGYPLGLQVEQTDYSWGYGSYANFIFIRYLVINRSPDTLWNCWMAPVMDLDIGAPANDHSSVAIDDPASDSLNLVVNWSEPESKRYGYCGFDLLESPATDARGFLRNEKRVYAPEEQLGLRTFKKWTIDLDPATPQRRYDYMSAATRDGDGKGGDAPWLMGTGPFSMRPGDTACIVVAILFAYGQGYNPTGSWSDMRDLIELDRFAQLVYDSVLQPTDTTRVDAGTAYPASSLSLGSPYPNPFGPATGHFSSSLRFQMVGGSNVSLILTNAAGMEVERRSLGWLSGGTHQVTIDGSSLMPGAYFYEIRTDRESASGKMIVE